MYYLAEYNPTEYLFKLIFTFPSNFLAFINVFCNKNINLTQSETIKLLKFIKIKTTFNIYTSSVLKELVSLELKNLPLYLLKNQSSSKYRSVKTLNGYPFDIAKSAIQKYTRRAIFNKSIYMMNDIFLMKWATEKSGGSITNFLNRLRIIYLEDIGIAAPYLLTIVNDTINEMTSVDKLSKKLVLLSKLMSFSLKTRCYSHIRAYYRSNTPLENSLPKNIYPLYEDEDLRIFVNNFVWCMENKDISVYYWMNKILEVEKLKTKRYKSTRPGFLIFEILYKLKFIVDKNSLDICFNWYKIMKMKEQFLCVMHPVYLYILQDKVIWEPPNKIKTEDSLLNFYNKNLLNSEINLDNYVVDMHTQKGRTNFKRTNSEFAFEGSLVSYDLELFPDFENIYYKSHMERGSLSSEKEEFIFKVRSQLNTSASKQDVYFAKNKLNQNVIVKGPYLNRKSSLLPFKIHNIMKLFSDVNYFDINVMSLEANMFPNIPLGIRNNIKQGETYYFIITTDLFNQETYPKQIKSSKLWKNEYVLDYEKLFENHKNFGYGIPSKMNNEALFSLVIQVAFRIAFKLGDFAYRNFIRVNNKVYNIDLENIMINDKINWSEKELNLLKNCCKNNFVRYSKILKSWLTKGNYHIDRWIIIEKTLTKEFTSEIKNRIYHLSNTILGLEDMVV